MAEGTKEEPWKLNTPPGTSSYTMYRDDEAVPPVLVCQVGRRRSATTHGQSTICTPGCGQRPTGSNSARATRRRTRARHRRGVGTLPGQSPRRMVRAAERLPRPIRHVPPSATRAARPRGTHPRRSQQQDASELRRPRAKPPPLTRHGTLERRRPVKWLVSVPKRQSPPVYRDGLKILISAVVSYLKKTTGGGRQNA